MAVTNDHNSLTFELILQPSSLQEKLLSKYKNIDPVVIAVLSDFLIQLQSFPNVGPKLETGFANDNTQRKRSFMQLMVLQIHAYYNWDLESIQKHLPLNLQSQLLETLLCSCGKAQSVFISNKESISSGEALQLKDFDRSTIFAVHLFLRWVIRTLPSLNEPVPPGNKIHLYGAGMTNGASTGVIPPDAIAQLNALKFTAVKTLESLLPVMTSMVPSTKSFSVDSNTLVMGCSQDEGWITLDESALLSQTLTDLISYSFYTEDYSLCRSYLKKICEINGDVLKKFVNVEMLEGYKCALNLSQRRKDLAESEGSKINQELHAWSSCDKALGRRLCESNVALRTEKCLPPNLEFFLQSSTPVSANQKNLRSNFLRALSSQTEEMFVLNEAPVVNDIHSPKISTKFPKLKKREMFSSLLRERKPDKVHKLLLDVLKSTVNTSAARLVTRWEVGEAQKGVLLSISNLAGVRSGIDADLVFVLLCKLKQLVDLKSYNDAPAYFNEIMRFVMEKLRMEKSKTMAVEVKINVQVLYLKMVQFNDRKLTREEKLIPSNFVQQCRDCFDHLLANTTNGTTYDTLTMDQTIVTLLNLGEFEFLLSRGSNKHWKELELASFLSSLVLHFRGKHVLAQQEFKKTFKALEDIFIGIAQSTSTSKKIRESSQTDFGKRLPFSFILKFQHADVCDLVKAFFVSCFNSSADATHAIQCDLPALPVSTKNSNLNSDHLLSLLTELVEHTSDGHRVKAEIHFARGNYTAAIQNYLEALAKATNYFTKPWMSSQSPLPEWDERIFQKMIKCTSELGNHLQTAVLCQFVGGIGSNCDYATAFRSLEERQSNDAMDNLYDFIWDITLLEYIVSMHAKRGELSRKRKSLEIIAQLEINSNNNEEILREARATRRSAFLRYMCSSFLRN